MAILHDLLAPESLEEFAKKFLFRRPYAVPGKAHDFVDLISWPLLEEIFDSGYADCWLPRAGYLPPEPERATGKLSPAMARAGFAEGRTILIRHAEKAHPALKKIADDFQGLFHNPIDLQIYGTPGGEEGFDWHYDVEEVFVLQSVGEKEFRLRPNTINPAPLARNFPKDLQFEREPPAPEIRCTLKAGDWLYIPSGWWHKARAVAPSFHLSVGVMVPSALEHLEALLPLLEKNRLWRQRVSRLGSKDLLAMLAASVQDLLLDEDRLP